MQPSCTSLSRGTPAWALPSWTVTALELPLGFPSLIKLSGGTHTTPTPTCFSCFATPPTPGCRSSQRPPPTQVPIPWGKAPPSRKHRLAVPGRVKLARPVWKPLRLSKDPLGEGAVSLNLSKLRTTWALTKPWSPRMGPPFPA